MSYFFGFNSMFAIIIHADMHLSSLSIIVYISTSLYKWTISSSHFHCRHSFCLHYMNILQIFYLYAVPQGE